MSQNYTGTIKGFQVLTTLGGKVSIPAQTSRDLNYIAAELLKTYSIDELQEYRKIFAAHTTSSENPHGVVIDTLSEDILIKVYEAWLREGNRNSYSSFVDLLFNYIEIAESSDELLSGESEEVALTVEDFFRLLYLFHTGPIYTHVPIMQQMFAGTPFTMPPDFSARTTTYETSFSQATRCLSGTIIIDIMYNPTDPAYTYFKATTSSGLDLITISRAAGGQIITLAISDGSLGDTINIPISNSINKYAITYDKNEIVIAYVQDDEVIINRVPRISKIDVDDNISSIVSLNHIDEFSYYPNVVVDDKLIFALN